MPAMDTPQHLRSNKCVADLLGFGDSGLRNWGWGKRGGLRQPYPHSDTQSKCCFTLNLCEAVVSVRFRRSIGEEALLSHVIGITKQNS